MILQRLKGKVVLVMGAGSAGLGWGNGKATAVLFAREGAHVLAVDVNNEAADEASSIIVGEGGRCDAIVADATLSGDVSRAVNTALERCGRVDILQNNIGGTVMGDPVAVSEEDWRQSIDLNLTSALLACKHV